jgi:hypothetical protein
MLWGTQPLFSESLRNHQERTGNVATKTATSRRRSPAKSASRKATVVPNIGKPGHNGQCVCEEIRRTAYQKWEAAGKPDGEGIKFKLEAEREQDVPMNVHISILRFPGKFRAILVNDGWAISTEESENELDAIHSEVGDQETARIRLYRLGLLLSHWLRIDFFPRARHARRKADS